MRKLVLCLVLAGCAHVPVWPQPKVVTGDAREACANLKRMRCAGWDGDAGEDRVRGNADDATCERAVEDIAAVYVAAPRCIASAASCEAAEGCSE